MIGNGLINVPRARAPAINPHLKLRAFWFNMAIPPLETVTI
jgi:hypothetical protein